MPGHKKRIRLYINNLILSKVGVAGFEPTTSSSRTTRATGLRYTPFGKNRCKFKLFYRNKNFSLRKVFCRLQFIQAKFQPR